MEIESKYLVASELPFDLNTLHKKEIEQAYSGKGRKGDTDELLFTEQVK